MGIFPDLVAKQYRDTERRDVILLRHVHGKQ